MKRYSKPIGNLFSFKQEFFAKTIQSFRHSKKIALTYRQQPKRIKCKNCDGPIDFIDTSSFTKLGVKYFFVFFVYNLMESIKIKMHFALNSMRVMLEKSTLQHICLQATRRIKKELMKYNCQKLDFCVML